MFLEVNHKSLKVHTLYPVEDGAGLFSPYENSPGKIVSGTLQGISLSYLHRTLMLTKSHFNKFSLTAKMHSKFSFLFYFDLKF